MTHAQAIEALRRVRLRLDGSQASDPLGIMRDALADLDSVLAFLESLPGARWRLPRVGFTFKQEWLYPKLAESVSPTPEATVRCRDCGKPYGDFGLDMTLPDDQWAMIYPDEGGVLCASCMVVRAAKLPDAIAARMRIEFNGPVAQQVEQRPHKPFDPGSMPGRPIDELVPSAPAVCCEFHACGGVITAGCDEPDPAPSAERCGKTVPTNNCAKCGHYVGDHWWPYPDGEDETDTSCQQDYCECPEYVPEMVRPSPGQEETSGLHNDMGSRARDGDVVSARSGEQVTPAIVELWLAEHQSGDDELVSPPKCKRCNDWWPCPVVRLARDWMNLRVNVEDLNDAVDDRDRENDRLERELAEAREEHNRLLAHPVLQENAKLRRELYEVRQQLAWEGRACACRIDESDGITFVAECDYHKGLRTKLDAARREMDGGISIGFLREERDRAERELAEIDAALDAVTKCQAPTRAERIKDAFEHDKLVTDAAIFDTEKAEQSVRAQVTHWMGVAKLAAEERDDLQTERKDLIDQTYRLGDRLAKEQLRRAEAEAARKENK